MSDGVTQTFCVVVSLVRLESDVVRRRCPWLAVQCRGELGRRHDEARMMSWNKGLAASRQRDSAASTTDRGRRGCERSALWRARWGERNEDGGGGWGMEKRVAAATSYMSGG
jgi:hypothetical protein